MIQSKDVKQILSSIKQDIITAICEGIKKADATEIKLDEPLMCQFVNEQANQSIDRVNAEQMGVEIDCSGFGEDYSIKLSELDTDILIAILECVEGENFEIWEDWGS